MKKTVYLLHNANAGEGCSSDDLILIIREAGFNCLSCEMEDERWQTQHPAAGFTVIAGGDGTVRHVIKTLLASKLSASPLLALLPMGTANNISRSLRRDWLPQAGTSAGHDALKQMVEEWKHASATAFDIGWLHGPGQPQFFIESVGWGMFPTLIKAMQQLDDLLADQPEERINAALLKLQGIVRDFPTKHYRIEVDGQLVEGHFLSVEVMNIRALGPNLELAADAEPSDGVFDVVVMDSADRERMCNYLQNKLHRKHEAFPFRVIKGASIRLSTDETALHVDDELVENTTGEQSSALSFTPAPTQASIPAHTPGLAWSFSLELEPARFSLLV